MAFFKKFPKSVRIGMWPIPLLSGVLGFFSVNRMNQPPVAPAPAPAIAANPPPVTLPAVPTDPNVQRPPPPVFPPTQQNVLNAVDYRNEVNISNSK